MEQQLDPRAKTHGWKGPGRRALSGDKPTPVTTAPAQQEPLDTMWALCGEGGFHETSYQADKEDSFSDCYLIRGKFSEPILDKNILLTSFNYLKERSEHELSQYIFIASSLVNVLCKTHTQKSFLNRLLERIHLLSILSTWQTSSFLLEEYPALTYQILNRLQHLLERSQKKKKTMMLQKKIVLRVNAQSSWRIELLWESISSFMVPKITCVQNVGKYSMRAQH